MKGEVFKLKLDKDWFNKDDVLHMNEIKLEVISKPNKRNYKWYHKLLNILTLGFYFNETIYYKVKEIK